VQCQKCQTEVRTDLPLDLQRRMAELSLGGDYPGVLAVGEKQGLNPRDVKAITHHLVSSPLRCRRCGHELGLGREEICGSAIVGPLTCSGCEGPAP